MLSGKSSITIFGIDSVRLFTVVNFFSFLKVTSVAILEDNTNV